MNTLNITDLYDILVTKVVKTEAKALTNYIESKIEKDLETKTRHLATREDLERGFKEQGRWFNWFFCGSCFDDFRFVCYYIA